MQAFKASISNRNPKNKRPKKASADQMLPNDIATVLMSSLLYNVWKRERGKASGINQRVIEIIHGVSVALARLSKFCGSEETNLTSGLKTLKWILRFHKIFFIASVSKF